MYSARHAAACSTIDVLFRGCYDSLC